MCVFYWLGKKAGYFSRKAEDGAPMGFGDALYSGVLGLFLGFPQSYLGIMAGSIAGIIFIAGELARAAATQTERRVIPYAPAFTIGAVLVALFSLGA
jgi:prepilin signal peptidase PulO-like enzyme (type II secretory pathway)